VKTKQPNVPVFLIYAGIIHAIGLALLLPMLVTLPGPEGEIAPETSVIDVEIIPAPPRAAIIVKDSEQTSALPSAPHAAAEDAAAEAEEEAEPVAAVEPEGEPGVEVEGDNPAPPQDEPEEAAAQPETTKADAAKSAKPAARKPVAARSRSAKPVVRRSAKAQAKIPPFNGALSGLFSPGGAGEAALGAISEDQAALAALPARHRHRPHQ
jgi:hypothetical protein